MISVYQLKPKFQQLLQPILMLLKKMGFTPNGLTLLALILSIATGIFCYFGPIQIALLLLPLFLLFRMALNALDGMMARQFDLQSKKGAVLNEIGDVLSDLALYYPLVHLFEIKDHDWIWCFLLLSVINEFAGLIGQALGGNRRYDGPMGKSDRALVIGLLCLLSWFGLSLQNYFSWIFLSIFILLFISTYKRLKNASLSHE
jgi:CDP-diacylglycerol--glycerol-3-phosphate 3-phosphatidyltransferase